MKLTPHLTKKGSRSQHPKRFGIMRTVAVKKALPYSNSSMGWTSEKDVAVDSGSDDTLT